MNLDKKFIDDQKKALEIEKKSLTKKIAELDKFPDYGQSEEDNAMETSDYEKSTGIEVELKKLLKETESALKAIDNGSYGACKVCKNAIEKGRLKLMPQAAICTSCSKKR